MQPKTLYKLDLSGQSLEQVANIDEVADVRSDLAFTFLRLWSVDKTT